MYMRRILLLVIFLSVAAAPPVDSSDPLQGQHVLDLIRSDPDYHARLRRDLARFNHLSLEQQNRIRQLDREVQEETSGNQARLLRAAERYTSWLERQSPEVRQRIESSPNKEQRLQVIREIRASQWIEQLPRSTKDKIEHTQGEERKKLLERLRADEKKSEQEWQTTFRHWDELTANGAPDRLDKFPKDVQQFVEETLKPRLNEEEKTRLTRASGTWPLFPRTLVELTDNSAFKLLLPATGPKSLDDFPEEIRKRISKHKFEKKKTFFAAQGQWPEFAIRVSEFARKENIPLPRQFGPCTPAELPKPIADFINNRMMVSDSILTRDDKEHLRKDEGTWPNYPQTLAKQIQKYRLQVPGLVLPGSVDYWDRYRDLDSSMVSDLTLRFFALEELTPEERGNLDLVLADPTSREKLQQEYIKRHPEEWQQLKTLDQQKRLRK